ncbi:hypothetical protein H6F90_25940 [Trichocoleus sp. FACHB-591]|uniref:hypothetical protein n=1 Tax=Trichocoleus sp. FACHB-591 TaxID=2692872 RepID=UPI00168223B1|nr:hypothetical protein [Trichocoleus sp. FACHB-591]MBD2098516.1 hypothetical protein [Trichocoleus sp. FACHB-591]
MLDAFHSLSEFSRTHCIAICAFLVPANLLATMLTLGLTALRRPTVQIQRAVGLASCFALVMVLHVLTWLAVGIVMPPTFILFWLASTCLLINIWAIAYPASLNRILDVLLAWFKRRQPELHQPE